MRSSAVFLPDEPWCEWEVFALRGRREREEVAHDLAGTDRSALVAGSCPPASGYTATSAEGAAAQTITFGTALNANVLTGAVVRFYRRAKYKLYQPAGSGAWYLGYMDCPGGVCGTMEPVAGPYLAYSATAANTGLLFVYRDATGSITTTPSQVARIDIIAKAQTEKPIRMPGRPEAYYSDSLVVTVALRNRA